MFSGYIARREFLKRLGGCDGVRVQVSSLGVEEKRIDFDARARIVLTVSVMTTLLVTVFPLSGMHLVHGSGSSKARDILVASGGWSELWTLDVEMEMHCESSIMLSMFISESACQGAEQGTGE